MNLGIFVGTYMDQKLDSKGRLSVPAKWRERLGTEFFYGLYEPAGQHLYQIVSPG